VHRNAIRQVIRQVSLVVERYAIRLVARYIGILPIQKVEPSRKGGFGGYVANSEDGRVQRSSAASHPDLPRGGDA
jgi:hypothetical protein